MLLFLHFLVYHFWFSPQTRTEYLVCFVGWGTQRRGQVDMNMTRSWEAYGLWGTYCVNRCAPLRTSCMMCRVPAEYKCGALVQKLPRISGWWLQSPSTGSFWVLTVYNRTSRRPVKLALAPFHMGEISAKRRQSSLFWESAKRNDQFSWWRNQESVEGGLFRTWFG